MKAQIKVLNKNYYSMDGNSGANLLVYGDFINTNNKEGISVSETAIDFSEHQNITVFPGLYEAEIGIGEVKGSNGKVKSAMIAKNVKFVEKLDLTSIKK